MTFTTKKTRVFSAFAAILMMLSLLTCFVLPVSAEEEGTFTIYRELYMDGKKVMDLPAIEGVNEGDKFAPADLELSGYRLTGTTGFSQMAGYYYMPGKNITLVYNNTVVDLDPLETVLITLSQYDCTLFVTNPVTAIEAFLKDLKAKGVKDGMTESELSGSAYGYSLAILNEDIAELADAAKLTNLKLKNIAPYLPKYASKDLYTQFGLASGSALVGYAITDAADWFAVLKDSQVKGLDFAGTTFYLRNDVDLENFEDLKGVKEVLPKFAGVLDGCGHSFKNVMINEAVQDSSIGLIGVLTGTGVVRNLGIANGAVLSAYRATDNTYGIAAVVGKAEAGATISKVWNAADVKVTGAYEETKDENGDPVGKTDYPVAGIVGVAEDGVKINGCYNLGVISAGDRVAELANGAAVVKNSFAAGANALAESAAENTYYLDDSDPYAFAHKLNAGYVPAEAVVSYTVDENGAVALVFDKNKAIVKVDVVTVNNTNIAKDFDFDYSFYAYADSVVTLDASYANGPYKVIAGSADVVGDQLHLYQTDVKVEVSIAPLDSAALIEALKYYKGKDAAAFEAAEELGAALARAKKNNYPNAEAMAKDVERLTKNKGKYTTTHPETLPSVSEMAIYDDAKTFGYTIRTIADLKLVAAAPAAAYGKLYLSNDLDLTGETFDGLKGLAVDFNGLGHVISGWVSADGGFFDGFTGSTIENVTFLNAKTEGASILMNEAALALTLSNVHVKSALIEKADDADLGFMIGMATAKVTVINSSVLGSQILTVKDTYAENRGILIGNATEVELKNIIATGNTVTGVKLNGGAGLLVSNASDVKAANIAVTYNAINANSAVAEGLALISNVATAVAENIYSEGNAGTYDNLSEGGAIAALNAGNAAMVTIYADAKTARDALNSAVDGTNGYAAWTMDATYKTPTLVIDGRAPSYTVTFNVGSQTIAVYPTDEFGHLFNYKNTDTVSLYTWSEISALATHVFTADAVLNGNAAAGYMSVETVGVATTNTPANVQVLLDNAPGLRAITLKVSFDKDNFELVNVANGDLFEEFTSYNPSTDPNKTGTFTVILNSAPVTGDGIALKMELKALNGEGIYRDAVMVEMIEAYDNSYNALAIEVDSADIAVEKVIWGDADGNRVVNSADVSMMLQYIVGKIDAVNNPNAVELDCVKGLTVVDAQIIFRALANAAEKDIQPLKIV